MNINPLLMDEHSQNYLLESSKDRFEKCLRSHYSLIKTTPVLVFLVFLAFKTRSLILPL